MTNAPGPGECSFLSGALQVQKSNAVYMAQRRTNSEVHATLHAQEFQCQRLSIFVALIGVLVRQQWLCLSRQDVAAFFLACASTFRPLRGNSLAALPQILSVGTFQKVQLQVRGTMQHSIPKACIHTANALEDVARMCRILRENFEQKVLSNAAWLIPEEVLLALDTCFNFEKYFAQPTPELDRSRCNAFATLAAYVKHRWPFAFPGELPAHALTGQYQKMLQHWWQLAKAPKLWLNGRLLWNEFWEATHAQQRFFVENTREAFFIWHAMGSIQSSEAACESIASQLKKYASTGGRAVEKAILREADVSFSDVYSANVCRSQEAFALSLRAAQAKRSALPFGQRLEDITRLFLQICKEMELPAHQSFGCGWRPKASDRSCVGAPSPESFAKVRLNTGGSPRSGVVKKDAWEG